MADTTADDRFVRQTNALLALADQLAAAFQPDRADFERDPEPAQGATHCTAGPLI